MAAYSGRRAIFAVYPALEDGLEISSDGPAPLHFEYKQKGGRLLVGYVAHRQGRYWLRVSRFGREALGSPFVLTVEEPPPEYRGNFGAGLWNDVPLRPPISSGIVDFVTQKMYMDEEGRLFKLNRDGSISNERYISKRKKMYNIHEIDKPCKMVSQTRKKPLYNDEVKAIPRRKSLPNPLDKHRQLIKTVHNEQYSNHKVLNILGTECVPRRNLVIPKITITDEDEKEEPLTDGNQSRLDQFLSAPESRYIARRTAKLERDDAVSSEPCDGRGQIGALPGGQSPRDNNLIDFILQSSRSPGGYHPSNLAASLGIAKSRNNMPGVRHSHDLHNGDPRDDPNLYRRVLNNQKKDYRHKTAPDRDLEINNFEVGKISPKIFNSKQLPTSLSDSQIHAKKMGTKSNTKMSRKRRRDLGRFSGSFRSLSLPDFSKILSLSVQGLRKAKSCSDRSFRALSSSSFSVSLKNLLFEKDQVYHFNKKNPDKTKPNKGAATLVRIEHYGSGKETKVIETSTRSVDEWKKYWETAEYKKQIEVERGCSLEIKGIVTKGKEVFETTNDENCAGSKPCELMSKENTPKNQGNAKIEAKVENKSAFQKAKEIFEGNYSSLKDLDDPRYRRKRSISERFHISSLSKDLYSGVTPQHLGIPNRLPVVASLGSIYNPVYPHLPMGSSPEHSLPWNDLLFSDPSYV